MTGLRVKIFIAVALATAATAFAQSFPSAPVKLVVPASVASSNDVVARIMLLELRGIWNQPVTIENKPGGEPPGSIGVGFVAKAPADGHTLLITSTSLQLLQIAAQPKLDPMRDLTAVSLLASAQVVLVTNVKLKAMNLGEFIDLARSTPLNFVSAGVHSFSFRAGEHFKSVTGINAAHLPTLDLAAALASVVRGVNDFGFWEARLIAELVKKDQLRAIAVTGKERIAALPDVPTMQEAGFGDASAQEWVGVLAPRGTPAATVLQIQADLARSLATPKSQELLTRNGYTPNPSPSAEAFTTLLRAK